MEMKYNNAIINIQGKVDREKVEKATIIFMRNVQRSKKNGNNNTSRTIKEKSLLVK